MFVACLCRPLTLDEAVSNELDDLEIVKLIDTDDTKAQI